MKVKLYVKVKPSRRSTSRKCSYRTQNQYAGALQRHGPCGACSSSATSGLLACGCAEKRSQRGARTNRAQFVRSHSDQQSVYANVSTYICLSFSQLRAMSWLPELIHLPRLDDFAHERRLDLLCTKKALQVHLRFTKRAATLRASANGAATFERTATCIRGRGSCCVLMC